MIIQETEKPETKNIVNIITKNFDDKDASEIRAEEGSYDKQVTEVERSNSLTQGKQVFEILEKIWHDILNREINVIHVFEKRILLEVLCRLDIKLI